MLRICRVVVGKRGAVPMQVLSGLFFLKVLCEKWRQ
jgi:hypothetical protein